MISYQITPSEPNHHLFTVSLSFPSQPGKIYELTLPAWLPGSYMIRDFAKNIIQLAAHSATNQPLTVTQDDKQSWSVEANDETIIINYQVFAFDLSVRTAYLDNQRAFFNGSSTFLRVKQLENTPCELTINNPEGAEHWQVATGLTRAQGTEKYTSGLYTANDYAELIDGPVAMGEFTPHEFTVEGITHHVIFTGEHYGDIPRLLIDLEKICQHHINLFGEAPFKEYWFITHLLANGFGGLEHKNSTILQASRFDLANPNQPEELSENYTTFLSLCSHEYFHAWNVCRIKPKEFAPYPLQEEVYTSQLWAYEGITSYYDDFSLFRAGIIDFDAYLVLLNKTATRVFRGTGELKQSVKDSSFNTWTKFYKQGPDAVNNIVSYYTKGALIALWLDLTIRDKSQGRYSLDNLMKELWIHFGRPEVGTQEEDFINIVSILCGVDIRVDFLNLLEESSRVDLAPLLKQVGVAFNHVKFKKLNSLDTSNSNDYVPYIGAHYKESASGLTITTVIEDSPAAQAGIAVNDVIVAVNNMKVNALSLQELALHLKPYAKVSCHYFRDDQLIETQLQIIDCPAQAIKCSVEKADLLQKWQSLI